MTASMLLVNLGDPRRHREQSVAECGTLDGMRCFALLSTVLDEVWTQLPGGTDAAKLTAIRAKEDYLHGHYAKLSTASTGVDYCDPATRYVYLCCYVTSHANLVAHLIEQHAELRALFDRDKAQVTCVGGGPGSDLLGVLKYTDKAKKTPSLKFFLYDREQAWSESWSDVDDKVGRNISTYFQPFDVVDPTTWKQNAKYLASDLFTMIYFASEIHRVRDQAEPFFKNLFAQAKPGALFLYVDNASSVFFEWFDEQYAKQNVTVLASDDGTTLTLPYEEDKQDLGPHYVRIKGYPKLKANIAYRVLRKNP